MMRSSSNKDSSVFDFNENDEASETSARELLVKFGMSGNAYSENSSHSNVALLEILNKQGNIQQADINDVLRVDFNGSNADKKFNSFGSYAVVTKERDFPLQEEASGLDNIVESMSDINDDHANTSQDNFHAGNLVPECIRMDSLYMGQFGALPFRDKRLDCLLPVLPSDHGKEVDVILDEDESMETSSLNTSTSDVPENEGAIEHSTSDNCSSGHGDMEKEMDLVTFWPDYVLYGDRHYTHSRLTFYSDCIKFEDLNACGSNESFSLTWAMDDIIHIESQWSESIETCLVTLRVRPAGVLGVDNVCSSSGIEKLIFAIGDPQWHEKEQTITSLAARYRAIWNSMLDGVREEDDFMGQHSMFFLKRYFTNFDEPFEDVIYPKGDPDAVSISKRDVELLQPETFINDTVIDFYIKYLKNKIQPEERHRFHFFNSFFFRKLADLDKDPGSALEGKAAFQRVRKWTRKINIFEKDYIFIPVNYNLHWSLIVICHPGEVASFVDEGAEKAQKVPCILHMDSIKGSHKGLKNLVQCYLCEEWKARHEESSEDASSKFSNLRFVPLELPQQENSFDCGLFLLHYVELFLDEAPVDFSPFTITKFNSFLNMDWFPPAEASYKRSIIQKLIYELLDDQRLIITQNACNNQCHSSEDDDTEKENAVELLPEKCNATKDACRDNSFPSTSRGIEMTFLPPLGVQCDNETGIILREFLEQGAIAGSSSENQFVSSKMVDTPMCPIKEGAESGELFISSDRTDNHVPASTMAEACTTSCSIKDVETFELCSQEILVQPNELQNRDSGSSEVGGNDHVRLQNGDFVDPIKQEDMDKQRMHSSEIHEDASDNPATATASTERLEKPVAEDSEMNCQKVNAMAEIKDGGDDSSCQEKFQVSSHPSIELTEIHEDVPDKPGPASTERLEKHVAEDSEVNYQEANAMAKITDGGDKSSCQERFPVSSHPSIEITEMHEDVTDNPTPASTERLEKHVTDNPTPASTERLEKHVAEDSEVNYQEANAMAEIKDGGDNSSFLERFPVSSHPSIEITEMHENVTDNPAPASTEKLEKLVAEDSEVNATAEIKDGGHSSSCQENLIASSHPWIDVQLVGEDSEEESEQHDHKRLKLMPPEVARPRTRSMARDSQS